MPICVLLWNGMQNHRAVIQLVCKKIKLLTLVNVAMQNHRAAI